MCILISEHHENILKRAQQDYITKIIPVTLVHVIMFEYRGFDCSRILATRTQTWLLRVDGALTLCCCLSKHSVSRLTGRLSCLWLSHAFHLVLMSAICREAQEVNRTVLVSHLGLWMDWMNGDPCSTDAVDNAHTTEWLVFWMTDSLTERTHWQTV